MGASLCAKRQALLRLIGEMDRVAVAFSGGVDSAYLLSACLDALGPEKVLAVTVDSPLLPREELDTARQVAEQLGARHEIVHLDELTLPEIAENPPDRCYYCKRTRFEGLQAFAARSAGDYALVHGENADDQYDYRPGARAAEELGVRAPLAEAGLTKEEIRILSRQRGLPTWDHPAEACLATRFPYGKALTREGLARVEAAEAALHRLLGARGLRVRDHDSIARIEVAPEMIPRVAAEPLRSQITRALREAGYRYVAVDLEGYRMGSMNDQLK
jgi:pyridinium-3,5-biscarboxylic acid mononucleotide sulfurtransferase